MPLPFYQRLHHKLLEGRFVKLLGSTRTTTLEVALTPLQQICKTRNRIRRYAPQESSTRR